MAYRIVTDSASNIPSALLKEKNITVIPLSYFEGDKEVLANPYEDFDFETFYDKMRADIEFKTSQVPPDRCAEYFEPIFKGGEDILFIGLSAGVSGTFNSAKIAAEELLQSYGERKAEFINSRGADMGEGLIVLKAAELLEKGFELEKAKSELEKYVIRVAQIFTVDDLKYLRRTGRISGFSAKVGSALNIKPILKGSSEGTIVSFSKVRGKKAAIKAIFDRFVKTVEKPEEQIIAISQADCIEDANELKRMILAHCTPKEIITVGFESVMGCHVGPGALALFFEGREDARL